MIGAGAEHELARRPPVEGEQRQRQAAHAAIGERDGIGEVAIRHHRRNRAERLDVVDGGDPQGSSARSRIGEMNAPSRDRRGSGSPDTIRADFASSATASRTELSWPGWRAPHLRRLLARIADPHLGEPLGQRRLHRVEMRGRRHRAADGGAFLPRLDRHLARHFLDEQVE